MLIMLYHMFRSIKLKAFSKYDFCLSSNGKKNACNQEFLLCHNFSNHSQPNELPVTIKL